MGILDTLQQNLPFPGIRQQLSVCGAAGRAEKFIGTGSGNLTELESHQ